MPAKNIKPMEDVPKGVSARLKETIARLAKEEAAKKVKRNPDGSRKKPGKPKPTAGKGLYKNVITKGGKAGLAIENKMRSEMKIPKLKTTGMRKAEKLAFKNTDKISKQGNKEKISGSVKTLKKTIKATTKGGRGGMGGGGLFGGGAIRKSK